MLGYRDEPGWYNKEREAMLTESRRRRALAAFMVLLVTAALMGLQCIPCPGGIGQY